MRYRSNIYVFTQTARYLLAVLLMLFPSAIPASSVNTFDKVSIAKSLGDVVNRVISETESSIDLGTGTIFGDGNCIRNNPLKAPPSNTNPFFIFLKISQSLKP